jgi:hypothetical protein
MRLLTVLLTLVLNVSLAESYEEIGVSWVFSTDQNFESATDNLAFAIESRGLVVSYTAHASDMLARTAEAVGVTTAIYGDAEVVLFCKSDLSHKMVADNPHSLPLCPYSISVYTLNAEPNNAYLAIRRPDPDAPYSAEIAQLLTSIIEEVQDGF